MQKIQLPDKLYYSISEVSDYFDVAPSLLRYWETEFSEIAPKRNKKGTRFYTKKDLTVIRVVHHLVKGQGFTIKGAKEKVQKELKSTSEQLDAIDKLQDIRSFLIQLRDRL